MENIIYSISDFEGPLDLLITLVRKHRVDIKQIPINEIADEFIIQVEKMKELDIKVTSDFMVMASTLMQMKSKALLPRLSNEEEECFENAKKEFYRKIEDYNTFKSISVNLKNQLVRSHNSNKTKTRVDKFKYTDKENIPENLLCVFQDVFNEQIERNKIYTINIEASNIEDRMQEIENTYERFEMYNLLKTYETRLEIIVTFLAILELIKLDKYFIEILDPEPIIRRK